MTYLGSAVLSKWSQIGPKFRALFEVTCCAESDDGPGVGSISTSGVSVGTSGISVGDDIVPAPEAPAPEVDSSFIFALFTFHSIDCCHKYQDQT